MGQQKSSQAVKDTLKKCDEMRFIFQHSPPYYSHTSSIGIAVLEYHRSKKA